MKTFGKVYVTENWSSRTACTLSIDNQEAAEVTVAITVRGPDQNAGGMEPDQFSKVITLKHGQKESVHVPVRTCDTCTITVSKKEMKVVETQLGKQTL